VAGFEAFRGTSYVAGEVEPDDVIAPPYDVVDAAGRALLAGRSPYNAIHVELPEASDQSSKYEHGAALFASWHADGVVAVSEEPALYVYRMTFADEDGSPRSSTGVLGALRLDPARAGDVLPHEETTSTDKTDRLSLLRAARTNFSPIWGLSLGQGLSAACVNAATAVESAGHQAWRATDDDGVVHEVWTVTEHAAIKAIEASVAKAPVLIADGHHRYDTACAYLEEEPSLPAAAAILAFVLELVEEQLSVQAIHRLIAGVDPVALPARLTAYFSLEPGPGNVHELQNTLVPAKALGLVTRSGNWLLKPSEDLEKATPDHLDSSRLAYSLGKLAIDDVSYQHGVDNVARAVESGAAAAGVLLRPVSVGQIPATAHGGRRMPPKSTFFHPKLRTGMVFRELSPG
jgi:uncharacterized protein (DUF1015 family)